MNRSCLVRSALAAALQWCAPWSIAQQPLEIIPLSHRTAEQVLPALQPLLEPGATLSGVRGQLFLRASPGNAAEVKRALAAIDRPQRRLVISVRHDEAVERERRELGVSGTVGSGGARVGVTAQDARRTSEERVDQRVQVLEGGRAFIATGQSRPAVIEGTTFVQEVTSGFEVVPRISGDRVFLDIAQQREGQGLATTVTGRLGQWVELGGVVEQARAGGMRSAQSRRVWVKVEELAN